jgi:5-methyltetrahydrofolate--homocysteine methyltransferase
VVLATVYGDVHDIGKNLVGTILANNGYTVIDLGKQVPVNTIIDKAVEVQADAIGLSALLVSTSKQMPACIGELARRGLDFPVIVGGAAINPAFGRRIAFLEGGEPYAPGVFYASDAFEGLALVERLVDPDRRADLVKQRIEEARRGLAIARPAPVISVREGGAVPPSPVIPTPPFWGVRALERIALAQAAALIDRKTLYRLQWGGKNTKGEAWDRLVEEEFEPRFDRLTRELEGVVVPMAVYGYFRCRPDGDGLSIVDMGREIARFRMPRQAGRERLSLADYFGQDDVVAIQAVTVGEEAARRFEKLQAGDQYTEAYYLHGFAVEAAEGVAEWVHRHIRKELGLGPDQGKRYSWGYPAIPDLEDHTVVARLLPFQAIDVSLTSAFQLVPEASTVALVVHHPAAKYFAVTDDARDVNWGQLVL